MLRLLNPRSSFLGLRKLSFVPKSFNDAQAALKNLKEEPDNVTKLKIYALFKQSSIGPCNTPKPGMMDFVGKAKWDAWKELGDMNSEEAKTLYTELIANLLSKESVGSSSQEVDSSDDIKASLCDGVFSLKLNRPTKKNAITWEMYEEWTKLMQQAAENPSVKVMSVTGEGDFFCSGNDIGNYTRSSDIKAMASKGRNVLYNFVQAFIDFPKPLVGLVNGPAIGISATTLALYDDVLASDNAYFHTPFPNLGITPEGCSSYTFPLIFGTARASRILLFNQKFTAKEAEKAGFVSRVHAHSEFTERAQEYLNSIAKQPPQATFYAKELLRAKERPVLHEVNRIECDRLADRWQSAECIDAVTKFFSKK